VAAITGGRASLAVHSIVHAHPGLLCGSELFADSRARMIEP
jgi:hypothetical protein